MENGHTYLRFFEPFSYISYIKLSLNRIIGSKLLAMLSRGWQVGEVYRKAELSHGGFITNKATLV